MSPPVLSRVCYAFTNAHKLLTREFLCSKLYHGHLSESKKQRFRGGHVVAAGPSLALTWPGDETEHSIILPSVYCSKFLGSALLQHALWLMSRRSAEVLTRECGEGQDCSEGEWGISKLLSARTLGCVSSNWPTVQCNTNVSAALPFVQACALLPAVACKSCLASIGLSLTLKRQENTWRGCLGAARKADVSPARFPVLLHTHWFPFLFRSVPSYIAVGEKLCVSSRDSVRMCQCLCKRACNWFCLVLFS